MSKLQVTDMLARAFAAEGVDVLFTLMGDANMYWSVAMSKLPGMKVVHARHEHCAVAMADGYARATGKVGVASTTCGPGFTQIMTALTISARSNTPLVVFAGDAPLAASWYIQQIDMAPLALACGAHYVGVKHVDRVLDNVREAFQIAQAERKPVVLSVPMDLQKQAWPHLTDYTPSSELVPMAQRPIPDPAMVERVVDMIAEAEKPVRAGRPRRHPLRRTPGARGAGRAVGRPAGDVAAGQGPVRRQSLGARHRRLLRQRLRARALRRGRPGDRRRRGARPLHDRGRLSLSRRPHRADRHQPARPVAGPAHRRPARARRRQGRGRGDHRAPEGARRVTQRLSQRRHGPADRQGFARTPRSSRSSPTPSIRARRSSSSTRRSPRTGTSSWAAATISASP